MSEMSGQHNTSGDRMPVVFVGHGSPMNAIEDNRWSRGFGYLASSIDRPRAILAISAHWYVSGTYLTGNPEPGTIHDFSGFPRALYEVSYPARGHVDLAKRVRALVGEERASLSTDWGLDHGAWSVLSRMYPNADIPIIQLSIDRRLREPAHLEIGRSPAELRDSAALLSLASETAAGRLSHPTPDHWLPLIYALGATDSSDDIAFTSEGFDLGSISMRNIVWG